VSGMPLEQGEGMGLRPTIAVPGSDYPRYQDEQRRARDAQASALAERHSQQALDLQLEADLRTSLNMDGWPAHLVFAIRIADVDGDYNYRPSYPQNYQDEIYLIEYGDSESEGVHTLHRWMNRHERDLAHLGQINRFLATGAFRGIA
jgi:hypothetical protein